MALGAAMAQPPLPDWRQLEAFHERDQGTEDARKNILAALPPGTRIETVRAALIADGASCRQHPHEPGIERCLIHQYSFLDGAADDIRWTLTLVVQGGRLKTILAGRYVDRHGSA
jgi:hypothetical protein